MSHLALYRKYRPQVFEDVIGQDHIVKTLISQIKNDNIGHAYLFCGTRGVGKTSIAKIFAKAINCTNNNTGSPCLNCSNCIENAKSSSVDILEIDAASNNGVDNIRDLKEKIQFAPVNAKYKVYIIDEVHMLSTGAFNALLKTLEEPPNYAVFILATTESYKIPATILSRCTKFDFKLVSIQELEKLVKKIFKEENITCDDNTISQICKAGEGSVRDTLSICDMLASFCDNNITYEKFLECMGTLNTSFIYKTTLAIKQKDISSILLSVKEISESGKNLGVLIKDMMEFYRNALITKTVKDYKNILKLPEDILDMLLEISQKCSEKELLTYLQQLSKTDAELRYSLNPRLLCETAFINMALYYENTTINNVDLDDLIERKIMEKINSNSFNIPYTQVTKVAPVQTELDKQKIDKKLEKINNNLEILEESLKQEDVISQPTMVEKNIQKETPTPKPLGQDQERKIVGAFIGKAREMGMGFVTVSLESCSYKLVDNKLYFIAPTDLILDTLKMFSSQIETIIKQINLNLEFDIVLSNEKIEKERLIKSLKSKFGENIDIK
ncbi:MAG: DNA polymerase III subunit gamma/tau [Clostridia bacterium]|nr:DNA polymerase III subunit gamma/tau [Clostridia bacterium]